MLAAAVGVLIGFALSMAPKSDASARRVVVSLPSPVAPGSTTELASLGNESAPDTADEAESEPTSELIQHQSTSGVKTVASPSQAKTEIFEIRKGDSLSQVFQRAGISQIDLDKLLADKTLSRASSKLQPGQMVSVHKTHNGQLEGFQLGFSLTETLVATKTESDSFKVKWDIKKAAPFTTYTQGTIKSSLFQAGKDAGLNTAMTMELAKIFGWDIDFALDIRKGDSFKVIYEELFVEGKKVSDGRILAAEFVNQGKKYTAVRFERKDGSHEFFSAEGNTLKKAFLRTPIDFARISSHFNLARMHPVLHMIRAHKGTDYAAGYGTPIKATGDGTIKLAGRQGGYGNVVIINHGRGYESLYAHMQKFGNGIKNGARVRQGQIIGYVGSSGLASGPHLHYEFHINGQVRNPVTVALPESLPIAGPDRIAFNMQSRTILKQMATFAGAYESSKLALAQER